MRDERVDAGLVDLDVEDVPQWYMKTPGVEATKLNVFDLPGMTSLKATFGAIRAAWKSTDCGIGVSFTSVTTTFWP